MSIFRISRMLVYVAVAGLPAVAGLRAAEIPRDERKSGYETMGPQARAMEDDDFANPATLWALDGETIWNRRDGTAQKSCADCHGDANASMRGVAARYPVVGVDGRATDLDGRIALCRTQNQGAPAFPRESHDSLAISAFVAKQSRGLPLHVAEDAATRRVIAIGQGLFSARQGQLDLSCAQCHDDNWGRSLGGAPIPQGHPTGYPLYRLEWQSLGSLQRRLRNCLAGMRAELYPFGDDAYVALELFLKSRAQGLPMDAPGVRP